MSVDDEIREAERLWREKPDDEGAFERAVAARTRAGLELPIDMLVRTRRWRALAAFVREWFGRPIEESDGSSLDEIQQQETKFGRPFPAAVREWFRLVGRREVVQRGAALTACFPRPVSSDGSILMICYEAQGVVTFAIARPDLELDDPPVIARVLDGIEEWEPVHDRTSEFFLALVMFYRVIIRARLHDGVRSGTAYRGDMARVIPEVERTYRRFSIAPWQWPTEQSHFVGDTDTTVFVSGHQIYAAARTPEAWERLDAIVRGNGGVWQNR